MTILRSRFPHLTGGAVLAASVFVLSATLAAGRADAKGGHGSDYSLDGGRGYDPYGKDDPYADQKRGGVGTPKSFFGERAEPKNRAGAHKGLHGGNGNSSHHAGKNDKDREKAAAESDRRRNPDSGDDRPPRARGGDSGDESGGGN
jgi:hypothetical protein